MYSVARRRHRRWLRVLIGLVVVVVLLIAAIVYRLTRPVHHYVAHKVDQGWLSGVYAGHEPSGDEDFAKWRGAEIPIATDFIGGGTWLQIEHPLVLSLAWRQDRAVRLVVSVPMWPATGGNLQDAAAGKYNSYYAVLAKRLVKDGRGNSVVRPGWEFNTPFFRWDAETPPDARRYATAFRQVVRSMRSVSGQHFEFVWNPNLADHGVDPAIGYPGDGYVDSVGLDVYDRALKPGENPQQRWNDLVHQRFGLQWQAQFAAAHGKPISFPEWGLVHDADSLTAGGDDPLFIRNMHAWFASHRTAFECYFDDPSADGASFDIDGQYFPQAAALYRQLFGTGRS
ncbi:MAG TPA: glycosyl hydrolase [Mycobacteriales bacterium]|nr:glycosyl hydrolase [Mycobacteriales bacterium]